MGGKGKGKGGKGAVGGFGCGRPVERGRTRPDGTRIEWKVTMPRKGVEGGDLPLWCRDITPREYRVPTDEEHVTHPCGAVGVGRGEGMKYEEAYKAAIGTEGLVMGLPRAVKGVQGPGVRIVERESEGTGVRIKGIRLRTETGCLDFPDLDFD